MASINQINVNGTPYDIQDANAMSKVSSPTSGDILTVDSNGQAVDSGATPLWHGNEASSLPIPINADLLEGHPASYFVPVYANAGSHNSIYRGKNIQSYFEDGTLYKRINGTDGYDLFEDLFIGDYFDITMPATSLSDVQTVRCMIAHFDYYLRTGDTLTDYHHVVIVPYNNFADKAAMHSSADTSVGYFGSTMYTTTLPIYATALASVFGEHLKTYRDVLSTAGSSTGQSMAAATYTGYASAIAWKDVTLRLMNEVQVVGATVMSSSFYDVGNAKTQLAYFKLAPERIVAMNGGIDDTSQDTWWLSTITNATAWGIISYRGHIYGGNATTTQGIRPIWLLS